MTTRNISALADAAKTAGVARIVSFGEHSKPRRGCCAIRCTPKCSTVEASILGHDVTYKLGAPGLHQVLNSLAVLAAAALAGADLAVAALALNNLKAGARPRYARRSSRCPVAPPC